MNGLGSDRRGAQPSNLRHSSTAPMLDSEHAASDSSEPTNREIVEELVEFLASTSGGSSPAGDNRNPFDDVRSSSASYLCIV